MPPPSVLAALSPKQRRTTEADVALLFSVAGFMRNVSIEDIKRLAPWHPYVEYNRKAFFLSERGVHALGRLRDTLSEVPELKVACSKREIDSQVAATHEHFISQLAQPTGDEFVSHATAALLGTVKDFHFLALISGLELKDVATIDLGSLQVRRPDRTVFEHIRFEGDLDGDAVYEKFRDALWLVGRVNGSPELAAENFRHRSNLAVGLLGIYGAVQYPGAVWRTRVRAIVPRDAPRTIPSLRWGSSGEDPVVSMKRGDPLPLPVTAESIDYVNRECFFRQLAGLMDGKDLDELRSAIRSAMYWFGDAYQDSEPTMKFVKLWSCMESFFFIGGEGVTESNARGIASVLTFAGYGVTTPAEYPEIKARLKNFYRLRSQAVHAGKVGHIGLEDLGTFSRWVAWVIISMMALAERGYRTLRQVHEATTRLDALVPGRSD